MKIAWLLGLTTVFVAVAAAPACAAFMRPVAVAGGGVGGSVVGALLCGYIASTKNRNPWGWALFGFFCCPAAVIAVLLVGPGGYR